MTAGGRMFAIGYALITVCAVLRTLARIRAALIAVFAVLRTPARISAALIAVFAVLRTPARISAALIAVFAVLRTPARISAALIAVFAVLRTPARISAALIAVFAVLPMPAHADTLTVGVFAPSAPFSSTATRVELASKLGEHLGHAVGAKGVGRVYARATDFARAVKSGDVKVALVDASYLAHASGYIVLGAAVRGGDANQGWQLIARGSGRLEELRGKRVVVPAIGGRETELVMNVLLGGELPRDFFAKVEPVLDTSSALSTLGLGKADVALVPVGVELPGGVRVVLRLGSLPGPVLVAYAGVSERQRTLLAAAAAQFRGDAVVSGFTAGNIDDVRALARRFTVTPKRGPFAAASVRLVVGELVERRTFAIERTPATAFLASGDGQPEPRP
ncbi:MAG: PhnD/SsuA/transferrin family substrate-binding protein [Kofleriaceae bacterium]